MAGKRTHYKDDKPKSSVEEFFESEGVKRLKGKSEKLKGVEDTTTNEIQNQESRIQDFIDQEGERVSQAGNIDKDYLTNTRNNWEDQTGQVVRDEGSYQNSLSNALGVSERNMQDATNTYEELKPIQREAMDKARDETQSAMSLSEFMDPNNEVAQGYRDLYNTEGQRLMGRYENQAQAAQRRGQSDFGILSSLGAQAAAGQSQGPMTVGMQMANMATANRQAGEAYANTQRRMQALRDAGMSGEDALRGQGLAAGERMSGAAYEAGRLSKEDLARRMGEFEGLSDRNINRTSRISDRMRGIAGDVLGSQQRIGEQRFGGQQSLYDLERGIGQSDLMRQSGLGQLEVGELGNLSDKRIGASEADFARRQGVSAQSDAVRASGQAARSQIISSGLGAAGQIGGAYVAGPAGAAAGGAAGQAAGGAIAPQPSAPQPTVAPTPASYGPQGYSQFQGTNPQTMYGSPYGQGAYGPSYPARPTVAPGY